MKVSRIDAYGVLWLLLVFAIAEPRQVAAGGRTELDLSGTWQYQKVSQLSFPPSNNWQTMTVPGFLSGWQYEQAWFRCLFTPALLHGGAAAQAPVRRREVQCPGLAQRRVSSAVISTAMNRSSWTSLPPR